MFKRKSEYILDCGQSGNEEFKRFIKTFSLWYGVHIYGYSEPYVHPEHPLECDFLVASLDAIMDCLCRSEKKVGGERIFEVYKYEFYEGAGWVDETVYQSLKH